VGSTAQDIAMWSDLMARSIRAAGGRPGDIVHVAYGYGLFTGGLGAHYGAEKLGCTVIPMSGGMTERQVQLIVDFKPDIIMVTPSYMLAITEEMERQRVDARQTSLRIGIFGAEPWTPAMRQAIEAKLDIDAIDIYGLSEITGRCDDMLIIRGVNVFPTQVEDLILRQPELTPHYLLEITRPGSLDEMTVHVEMCAELAQGGQELRQAAAKSLEQNIKGYIG